MQGSEDDYEEEEDGKEMGPCKGCDGMGKNMVQCATATCHVMMHPECARLRRQCNASWYCQQCRSTRVRYWPSKRAVDEKDGEGEKVEKVGREGEENDGDADNEVEEIGEDMEDVEDRVSRRRRVGKVSEGEKLTRTRPRERNVSANDDDEAMGQYGRRASRKSKERAKRMIAASGEDWGSTRRGRRAFDEDMDDEDEFEDVHTRAKKLRDIME